MKRMKPAPVWNVVIYVFRFLDKYISLPIQYDPEIEEFQENKKCFTKWYQFHKMTSFRFGSLCVLTFFLRTMYILLLQIVSPSSNDHLNFGLEGVLLYLLGFFFCFQAVTCFWTVEFRLDYIVSILNLLLRLSKSRPPGYFDVISKVSIAGYICIDTGQIITVVATIGFIGFPGISGLVPFVMDHNPASDIALTLLPERKHSWIRPILAGFVQGSVATFGAIVCLQVLLVFILILFSMGEMMNYAITDDNLNKRPKDLQDCGRTVIDDKKGKRVKPSLTKAVKTVRKSLNEEAKYFGPSLMIHRQLTIIQRISSDCLICYIPGLIFVGMSLIIVTLFFSIRFDLPIAVAIPNMIITVTASCIMIGVAPVMEGCDRASQSFRKFWTKRLRFELAKKLLVSCRHCILIPIGPFAMYKKGTHLLVWNLIFQQLATLLINF